MHYTYVFFGVYQTYEGNVYSGVNTIDTYPSDESSDGVARALHNALGHYYREKGYWTCFSVVSLDKGGKANAYLYSNN
jgi:hypothetical protein